VYAGENALTQQWREDCKPSACSNMVQAVASTPTAAHVTELLQQVRRLDTLACGWIGLNVPSECRLPEQSASVATAIPRTNL